MNEDEYSCGATLYSCLLSGYIWVRFILYEHITIAYGGGGKTLTSHDLSKREAICSLVARVDNIRVVTCRLPTSLGTGKKESPLFFIKKMVYIYIYNIYGELKKKIRIRHTLNLFEIKLINRHMSKIEHISSAF